MPRRPRGRPSSNGLAYADTRDLLLRRGVELLTESGFSAISVDAVMKSVGVAKGSFYHYFPDKEAFVREAVGVYAAYFAKKLGFHFSDERLSPMDRLGSFVDDACAGIERFGFVRGCLIGNLGQEPNRLEAETIAQLEEVLLSWEDLTAKCLQGALRCGQIREGFDPKELARFFWIGWEGAILRARLMRSVEPMRVFFRFFADLVGNGPLAASPQGV